MLKFSRTIARNGCQVCHLKSTIILSVGYTSVTAVDKTLDELPIQISGFVHLNA